MSTNPVAILGLECGLRIGRPADLTIINPDLAYTVDAADFQSLKPQYSFLRLAVEGKPVLTMVGGRIV
jgi:dihydroorotase